MAFLDFLSNPIWRARESFLYWGDAGTPILWTYDSNGYASPAPGWNPSQQDYQWMSDYNSGRATLNAANQQMLDNVMADLFPISNSLLTPLTTSETSELINHLNWIHDHENGSAFYWNPANYFYYPDEPDWEADFRYQRLNQLLDKAGLKFNTQPLGDKVNSGVTSPIVIDLGPTGIQTTSLIAEKGVFFDITGDGIKERSAWLSGEDAFLVVDRNGNGVVDGIGEMFGGPNRGDGFAELAEFDSNADGVIDHRDARFSELMLWQDENADGITDKHELKTVHAAGLTSISLDYRSQEVYESGNLLGEVSTATVRGKAVAAVDVYFRYNTIRNESFEDAIDWGPVPTAPVGSSEEPTLVGVVVSPP